MNRQIVKKQSGMTTVPARISQPKKKPAAEPVFPERGSTGPVSIGTLMEPMQALFRHPNRNRLIAELFKDYK